METEKPKTPILENPKDLIDAHKHAMLMSGKLSDFQIENLKKWPFIYLDNVDTVSINYNFTKNGSIYPGTISFDFKFKENTDIDKQKENLKYLEVCVKALFFQDTDVQFLLNGSGWLIKIPEPYPLVMNPPSPNQE
jgi:hypothetical protein